MPALALHNVNFTYPAHRREPVRHALRDVTLTIEPGQSVALLGPNGSGKSTLIRIITGMLAPSSGEARLFDRPPQAAREMLGVVFQHPGLDRHMTVWENLRDSAALYGVSTTDTRNRCDALLNELRLSDRRDALVKTLSGGLARRVDLCRALLAQPRLLILDEPTTGLDPTARREFLDHLLVPRPSQASNNEPRPSGSGGRAPLADARGSSDNHSIDSLTLLMSTHLIDEAERMERVLMMHDGRIVADGSPAELRRQLGAQRVTVFDAGWQPATEDSERWTKTHEGWTRDLNAGDSTPTIAQALALAGTAFSIAPPTLSDVFERLTGSSLEIAAVEPPKAKGRRRREAAH